MSGLDLTLDPDVQIIGDPVVGARVRCVLRAPGDGSLILIYAEVEEPAGNGAPAPAATPPTATPTRPRARLRLRLQPRPPRSMNQRSARPRRPICPTNAGASRKVGNPPYPLQLPPQPECQRQQGRQRQRLRLQRRLQQPWRPHAPTCRQPRVEPLTYRIEGWVESIEGGQWIINGIVVNVNGATKIIDDPDRRLESERVSRERSRWLLYRAANRSPGAGRRRPLNRWSSPTSSRR